MRTNLSHIKTSGYRKHFSPVLLPQTRRRVSGASWSAAVCRHVPAVRADPADGRRDPIHGAAEALQDRNRLSALQDSGWEFSSLPEFKSY